jgi:hypothetical protein
VSTEREPAPRRPGIDRVTDTGAGRVTGGVATAVAQAACSASNPLASIRPESVSRAGQSVIGHVRGADAVEGAG